MKLFQQDFIPFLIGICVLLALFSGIILGKALWKNEAEQQAYEKWCCATGSYCCFEEKTK